MPPDVRSGPPPQGAAREPFAAARQLVLDDQDTARPDIQSRRASEVVLDDGHLHQASCPERSALRLGVPS